MRSLQFLDPNDMSKARSPRALFAWVMSKCTELSSSAEAKAFARSGAQLAKKFYDEIYPLSFYALGEYRGLRNILVRPNLGNENFDAKISIGLGPAATATFVEVTYAKDGYNDSLRMEVLAKEGHVFLTGPVSVSGKRGAATRSVSVQPRFADHSDTVNNHLALVETRIVEKCDRVYGKNFVLVVAVDDYFALLDPAARTQLQQMVKTLLPTLRLDFGRVVLVGVAGRVFRSFEVRHHADQPCPL